MVPLALDSTATRTAEIIAHAAVALDGQANAMGWLKQPHSNLANRTPLFVLFHGIPEELQLVDELLSALENGIYT